MENNTPFVLERTLHAPQEKVWEALTDVRYLKQWLPFFPDFRAEVGFEARFELGSDDAHKYLHICRVLEVIEGKKLSYTWKYDGHAGDSFVTFELFPEGDITRLKLTHTITEAFEDKPDFALENFKKGWTYSADALKDFVEKGGAHE